MRDSYVRVPTLDGYVKIWNDVLQLPNEIIENSGGDCEDLALLVYSVLKRVAKPSEEIYLLFLKQLPEEHAVVLAIDKDDKIVYLIDPSFSFINGFLLMIEITAEGKNSELLTKHIMPMAMNPGLKRDLLAIFKTRIAYVDYFKLRETGEKVVYYKPKIYVLSAEILFKKYLSYTKLNPISYVVVSRDEILLFTDLESLVEWINNKLTP